VNLQTILEDETRQKAPERAPMGSKGPARGLTDRDGGQECSNWTQLACPQLKTGKRRQEKKKKIKGRGGRKGLEKACRNRGRLGIFPEKKNSWTPSKKVNNWQRRQKVRMSPKTQEER